MDKVVKIINLKDKQSDFLYWQSKSELERLEAIEILREQFIKYKYNASTRLQRVCRVTHKA
jgi:hypothetical protein